MIKFTDEQKRELLNDFQELHKKSVAHIKEIQEKPFEFDYNVLREVEKDLTKFNDEEWGYIFVYSLLSHCSNKESSFSYTKWMVIIGLLDLYCNYPQGAHYGEVKRN